MQRVYCDTCVFMDAMGLNDNDDPFKALVEFAWNFFDAVKRGEYILVTSSWVFEEFKKRRGGDKELHDFIDDLQIKNKIHIKEEPRDIEKAEKLSKRNKPDARHVILAKKANAHYLTTQDTKDFKHFVDYMHKHGIRPIKPESL